MFIVQKLIWFIFGTKRDAITASSNASESQFLPSADAISPRRVVALLNVGSIENARQLPRIGQDRAWAKLSHAVPKPTVLGMVAGGQSNSSAPGLARPDYANHRRLTALR